MAWLRSHKKGSGTSSRLWLFNPNVADEVALVSNLTSFSDAPYLHRVKDGDPTSVLSMGGKYTFDGSNQAVIYRNGKNIASVILLPKIPHGIYSKVYIYCQVTASTATSYMRASIVFTNALGFDSNAIPTNQIKNIVLVNPTLTPAQINSQTGVTINSTDSSLLSAQIVEIDISDLTDDFYVGFWNCDRNIMIRSLYLE